MTLRNEDRLHSCPVPKGREPTLHEEMCEMSCAVRQLFREMVRPLPFIGRKLLPKAA